MTVMNGRSAAEAQEELAKQNRDNAVTAQTYQNRGINEQIRQSEDIASINKRKARTAAIRTEGTMKAQGRQISGSSMKRFMAQTQNALGEELSNIVYNTNGNRRQAEMSKKATTSQTKSRINSTPYKKYNPANDLLDSGLSIYTKQMDAKRHKESTGGDAKAKDSKAISSSFFSS